MAFNSQVVGWAAGSLRCLPLRRRHKQFAFSVVSSCRKRTFQYQNPTLCSLRTGNVSGVVSKMCLLCKLWSWESTVFAMNWSPRRRPTTSQGTKTLSPRTRAVWGGFLVPTSAALLLHPLPLPSPMQWAFLRRSYQSNLIVLEINNIVFSQRVSAHKKLWKLGMMLRVWRRVQRKKTAYSLAN